MHKHHPPNAADARKAIASATCVILDFDGVIADSEEFQLQVWREMMPAHGLSADAMTVPGIAGLLDEEVAMKFFAGQTAEKQASLVAEKKQVCNDRADQVELVPGIAEFLWSLHQCKRICICSSSSTLKIRAFIDRQLPGFGVEEIVGRGDYKKSKPNPDPYLTVVSRAKIGPADAIVIEDSDPGLQAATAAGLCAIRLDRYGQGAADAMVVTAVDQLYGWENTCDHEAMLPDLPQL